VTQQKSRHLFLWNHGRKWHFSITNHGMLLCFE